MKSSQLKLRTKTSDAMKSGKPRRKGRKGPKRISYMATGRQLYGDIASLRRLLNVEVKYVDTTATQAIGNTTIFTLLNGLATGLTAVTRNGQSVKLNGIDLRFILSCNTALVSFTRIMLVMDHQPNGAIFADTDLLSTAASIVSPYLVGAQKRFSVLYDETFVLTNINNVGITVAKRIPTSVHVEFNLGQTAVIGAITTNSIYMLYVSDQAVNVPSITYYNRIWFVDN